MQRKERCRQDGCEPAACEMQEESVGQQDVETEEEDSHQIIGSGIQPGRGIERQIDEGPQRPVKRGEDDQVRKQREPGTLEVIVQIHQIVEGEEGAQRRQ